MKLSEHRDPWNAKKSEIDPWESSWRKKHEEQLMQGKGGRPCAFSEQEHSHGGKTECWFPTSGRSLYQKRHDRNTSPTSLSSSFILFLVFAIIFGIYCLYALVDLITVYAYNESLFMYLFWAEYIPPLFLLGGLTLLFLGRWKKSK